MIGVCQLTGMKPIAGNDNRRVKQTMIYFKHVAIFRNKLYPSRNIRNALCIFVVLISQSLENKNVLY